jgi:serine protease
MHPPDNARRPRSFVSLSVNGDYSMQKIVSKAIKRGSVFVVVLLVCFSASLPALLAQETDETAQQQIFLPLVFTTDGAATEQITEPTTVEVTNQMIVRYRATTEVAAASVDQLAALQQVAGVALAYGRELADNAHVLRLPTTMTLAQVSEIAHRVATLPEIEYAEPDVIMQPWITPNDTQYGNQWHYFPPVAGTYGANLPGAWDITTGSPSVVIAIIDTGILPHADLAGRTVPGYDFIVDTAIANDGNGRDADPSDPGDWVTAAESASGPLLGCQVRNSSWHGTHVAGTIGANSNNAFGVAGINWQSKIEVVRVLGKCGGYSSDIVDGIRWAAGLSVSGVPANANPAKVINMSLGGSGVCGSTYQNAINAAVAAGTVVVVAAGNSNANAANYQPASCAGVITVASTGRTGSRAYYSNFGATVEIAAPGGDTSTGTANGVLSTLNTGTTVPAAESYAYYQGTSMATPHVVGLVSLLFSVNPTLTPAQVLSLLQGTVTPFPAGSSCTITTCGPGIINAAAAVAAAAPVTTPPSAFAKSNPVNGSTGQATSLALSWAASSGAASYEYCLDTSNDNSCAAAWVSTGAATSVSLSSLLNSTTYYWQVRAVNPAGSTQADSSTWWSFATQAGTLPAAFNKTSPANNSTNQRRNNLVLDWNNSSGATSYQYCLDTTNNDSCDGSWVSTGTTSQISVSSLAAQTTYYWQVRANNASGTTTANGVTWWNFRTR